MVDCSLPTNKTNPKCKTVDYFIKKINKCKVNAKNRRGRDMCLRNVNREIVNVMEIRWGLNALGCKAVPEYRRESSGPEIDYTRPKRYSKQEKERLIRDGKISMENKLFGIFLVKTLYRIGKDFKNIRAFKEPTCRRGAEVLGAETKDGKGIFFKTSGTTMMGEPLGAPEIRSHREVVNIANAIGEDVPIMLNAEPNRGLIAFEGLKGRKVFTYDDAPAQEIADAILFETIIGSFDRSNNVFREGDIIKQIDFDDVAGWREGRGLGETLSRTPERLLYEGLEGKEDVKKALISNLNWYWKNRGTLKALSPELFDEGDISERVMELHKRFDIPIPKEAYGEPIIPRHKW